MIWNILVVSYILIVIFLFVEIYLESLILDKEDQADWPLVAFMLVPFLNHICFLLYLGAIFFDKKNNPAVPAQIKKYMHIVFKCRDCNINSYFGRVKQNNGKCPFCESVNLREVDQEHKDIPEDAPLSVKMSFKECLSILGGALKKEKVKAKQKKKEEKIKQNKEDEIKQANEEYAHAEFKDKQLEAYLKLQQKKLDSMVEKRLDKDGVS